MKVIYADELFLENFIIDYILLIATARITGTNVKRTRAAAGAFLGGIYSIAAVLTGWDILLCIVVKLGTGGLMVLAAFGAGRRYLRSYFVFMAVSAAFAGAVIGIMYVTGGTMGHIRFVPLVISFVCFYLVFSMVFREIGRHRVSGEISRLTIKYRGRSVVINALVDTGNGLVDPVTGRRVTVCALEAISGLFDKNCVDILRNTKDPALAIRRLAAVGDRTPFALVPYRALGVEGGMLLAFRPDSIERDGKIIKGGMVAVSREDISAGNGYAALTDAS